MAHILIVDDEPGIRGVLRIFLEARIYDRTTGQSRSPR